MELLPITSEGIAFIQKWSPNGVCEIGARDGAWVEALNKAGVEAIGYDTLPGSQSVRLGDHINASVHNDKTLLIIWPPDGAVVQEWITSWRGDTIIIGINKARVELGDSLSEYDHKESIRVFGGRKGCTTLSIYEKK